MNSKHLVITLVFLVVFIALLTGTILWYRSLLFTDIKNESDCSNKTKLPESCQKDSKCCGAWDENGKVCRKGKTRDGLTCEAPGNVGPLILGIGSVVSFVLFIFFLINGLRNK